jgi:aminodeoxyfutalosine synthase
MAFGCSSATDLLAVGWLANREREQRHGARTYYNYNLRLEPTNVCEASCLFCSFARLQPGMPEAYTMSLEQAWDKLRQRADQPLTELHIVNGLNPSCRSATTRSCCADSNGSGRAST